MHVIETRSTLKLKLNNKLKRKSHYRQARRRVAEALQPAGLQWAISGSQMARRVTAATEPARPHLPASS